MAKAEVAAIEKRCEQIAADMGYELVDVAIEKEPTGKYLRFYIDRPEGIWMTAKRTTRQSASWLTRWITTSWKSPRRGLTAR